MRYDNLLGREFSHGNHDCFGLVRDFYNQNWDLNIPNYARPTRWWDKGMNMYVDLFRDHGFVPLTGHPDEWRAGDGVLMCIRSTVANHSGVFVEGGKILHHFVGRRSCVEDYRAMWRNATIMVVRHPKVIPPPPLVQTIDFKDLLPNAVRQRLSQAAPFSGDGRA